MDDDKKRPAGAGGTGRGPKKPAALREDGKKPFQRQDGMKRAYGGRDGEAPRKPRPGKWERREERAAGEGNERRPRKPDAERSGDGERPRFEKRAGEARPFRRPEGDKPFRRAEGDKPFRKPDGGRPRPAPRMRNDAVHDSTEAGGGERIAKRLARAGISSRRDAEALIAAGRITLNGKLLTSPAVNVSENDRIELDGKEIPAIERTRLFLFHKPAGVVTTSRDPEGRPTVFDVLPKGLPRLMTVGRLDINTEGLLLLTNDGGLSRVLELPATGWLRRYRVRVHGKVETEALERLKDGIAVDGTFYGAIEATLDREQGSNAWLTVGFREGKNREVKNVLGALGLEVNRLIRVSYGPFQLGELAEGEIRELKGRMLREQLGERLIEESGANFEAPVLNEFSNKPVSAREQPRSDEREEQRPNRKREREQKREDALGRLDTKRPPRGSGGGKPFGREGRGPRDEKSGGEARPRTANVWMAPGARPMGEKKAAALAERNEGRRYAGKPRPEGGGKPRPAGAGKPRPADARRDGPPRGKPGPRKPRGDR